MRSNWWLEVGSSQITTSPSGAALNRSEPIDWLRCPSFEPEEPAKRQDPRVPGSVPWQVPLDLMLRGLVRAALQRPSTFSAPKLGRRGLYTEASRVLVLLTLSYLQISSPSIALQSFGNSINMQTMQTMQMVYSAASPRIQPAPPQRASAACQLCRTKKVRCDARDGKRCSNCAFDNTQCVFLPRKARK